MEWEGENDRRPSQRVETEGAQSEGENQMGLVRRVDAAGAELEDRVEARGGEKIQHCSLIP